MHYTLIFLLCNFVFYFILNESPTKEQYKMWDMDKISE